MIDMTKEVETLTYCLCDYRHKHNWESIGATIGANTSTIFEVFKCIQCGKAKVRKLEEITRI